MKAEKQSRILILGGGPAGISAGYELSRNGYPCTVLERYPQTGGLARTLRIGDFLTDIGPHRFFSKNQYLYDMIEEVLGDDWILVNRFTRFYIQGKFYLYPVDLKDALSNMGPMGAMRAFLDYLWSRFNKMVFNPRVESFEDFVVQEFGRTLAELNMINYTEKIWGIPCRKISPDWARQRIKGLSIMSVIKKALFKNQKGPKTLVDQFYYPRYGAGQTYEKMAEKIARDGGKIHLSSPVAEVFCEGDRITSVGTAGGEKTVKHPGDFFISSIPITSLISMMNPPPPDEVLEASSKLRWRSQVYLYLQLKKERVSRDNWVYFPDREIPFGRIHEAKNFSVHMSPQDRTTLWVEHFVFEDDPRWEAEADYIKEITMKDLDRLGFVKEEDVEDFRKFREDFVYPVYELGYEEHLRIVKDYLGKFINLQLVGRPGRFRYNNQDHSMETGILAARNLVQGAGYDLEEVGAEEEYFEKYQLSTKEKGNGEEKPQE